MYNISFAQPSIYPYDQNWQLHWEDNFSSINTNIWEVRDNHDSGGTQIPNFNTYNYAVKKYISLSNTTTIPPNSNITLRAAEYIELTNGFEVPLGAELYLDVSPCDKVNVGQKYNRE